MSDIEKVKEMAKLSVLSGRISEIQEKNLKLYPFVFFDSVKEVNINYDLSYTKTANDEPVMHNSRVTYYLEIDEAKNDSRDYRFKSLENAVRTLFWKDLSLEIYFNDKIVFKSK